MRDDENEREQRGEEMEGGSENTEAFQTEETNQNTVTLEVHVCFPNGLQLQLMIICSLWVHAAECCHSVTSAELPFIRHEQ